MTLMISIGLLTVGFAILLLGGDFLVRAAVSIALRTHLSPAVIGLTIIAAGTSAPELITSLLAALREAPDIAIGNIVGSNIFNILAILGISALIRPHKVTESAIWLEWPFLFVSSIVFIWLGADGLYSRGESVALLVTIYLFLAYSVWRARTLGGGPGEEDEEIVLLKSVFHDVLFLLFGVACLIGGAQLALDGGIRLGHYFELSERIIGVTIISIGTGLPELATSAVAARKGRSDIAVANVIGSNIMNTLGIVGHTALIVPIPVSKAIRSVDFWWMLAVTLLIFPFMKYQKLGRKAGLFLILCYGAYIAFLIRTRALG